MKKIIITLTLIVLVAAALPIIGNTFMQSTIETRVDELKEYGLESQNGQSDVGYLSTRKHFEFLLKDADAFVEYLNKYADGQIPPYVNAMLEGVLIGVDLNYSNIPFSNALELDIYPLSMSPNMAKELQKENLAFYNYLEAFLHSKGILYHINYNIMSENFDGFIKNIDEKYEFDDGVKLLTTLKDTTFEGEGELIAPQRLSTALSTLRLEFLQKSQRIIFDLKGMQTATSYASKNTYLSSVELKDFHFIVSATDNDIELEGEDIKMNVSSNTQGEFAEIDSKSSLSGLEINSKELNLKLKNFNIDLAVDGLDKQSFMESSELISKIDNLNDPRLQTKLEQSLTKLISKGFVFRMADFSVEDIVLDEKQKLTGFKMQSQVKMKGDKDFAQKVKISPLLLLTNIGIDTRVRVSKEIYAKLSQQQPASAAVKEYLKEDGDDYIFDFHFLDGNASLNGKALR